MNGGRTQGITCAPMYVRLTPWTRERVDSGRTHVELRVDAQGRAYFLWDVDMTLKGMPRTQWAQSTQRQWRDGKIVAQSFAGQIKSKR